jgi:hypothetical protein
MFSGGGDGLKTVAKPARQFGHAMQILNYSFLQKLIVFTVYEHGNICMDDSRYTVD